MNTPEAARLARVERQVAYLLQHLGIDPEVAAGSAASGSTFGSPGDTFGQLVPAPGPVGFSAPAPASPASHYPPELLAALQRGRMIEAIKIYREVTGASLKEAKSACEALAKGGLP
ncbi:MAG TPA: hypothetical protein VHU92_22910 [Streptosporangiaceae bacterium]|nr:hypothetical protein [Streptosporangiaceae bacterium]